MDNHRHIECDRELKKWQRFVIVGVFALQAGSDPRPFQTILLHCAFELAKEAIVAIGHRRRKAVDRIVFLLLGRDKPVVTFDRFELLFAIHVAHVVQRIADHRNIDATDFLRFQDVLDGMRRTAAKRGFGENLIVKFRFCENRLVFVGKNVRVKINDHASRPAA